MAVFFSGRETACFEIQSTPLSFKVDDKNLIQLSRQGHLMCNAYDHEDGSATSYIGTCILVDIPAVTY